MHHDAILLPNDLVQMKLFSHITVVYKTCEKSNIVF